MNYKLDRINSFLFGLQMLSKTDGLDLKQVYLQLLDYGILEKERVYDLSKTISILKEKYKKSNKVLVSDFDYACVFKSLVKNQEDIIDNIVYSVKLNVSLSFDNLDKNVIKIIDFMNKNKIIYNSKLSKNIRIGNFVIELFNVVDADKVCDFINSNEEISNSIYEPNPFCITEGKVHFIIEKCLSYNDILSKYLYNYIILCNKNNVAADVIGFKQFLYYNIVEFIGKEDLSKQIKLLDSDENISKHLIFLEDITNLIYLNLQNINDNVASKSIYYEMFNELNKEKKDVNRYRDFSKENFKKDSELFKEIISTMTYKYGFEYTKSAIYNYKNYSNIKDKKYRFKDSTNYITRKNNLRFKVKKSKSFRTYINSYSDEELEKKIKTVKPIIKREEQEQIKTKKEMILEDICKETYLSCQISEREFTGKAQVVRALIRMQSNDYTFITRENNARTIAKKHIKPEDVIDILKKSIELNGYIIEDETDLYELYAAHIEYLCGGKENNNVKK